MPGIGINIRNRSNFSWSRYWATQPELKIYVDGLTTRISNAQIFRLGNLIDDIKSALSISLLSERGDVLYIRANETQEASLRNLIKNAHHSTSPNMPDWAQYEGFTGDGSKYIDWNFNPDSEGDNFKEDSAIIGLYSRTDYNESAGSDIGARAAAASKRTMLYPRSANVSGFFVNTNSTTGCTYSSLNSLGIFAANRSANNAWQGLKNGQKIMNGAQTGDGLPAFNIYEHALNSAGSAIGQTNKQISISFAFGAITEQEWTLLSYAFIKYMKAIGKNVVEFAPYFMSPNILENQGYCYDGQYHYSCYSLNAAGNRINKRNNDATWSVLLNNTDPFNGLTLNYFGGMSYYNSKLYIASGKYDAPDFSEQSISVFNSSDLARVAVHDISGEGGNVSAVHIEGGDGIAYVCHFEAAGSDQIYMYDLSDWSYLGAITIASPIIGIQGIYLKNGYFYITSHDNATKLESVYKVKEDGTTIETLFQEYTSIEIEDIDYSQDELRVHNVNGAVFFFDL